MSKTFDQSRRRFLGQASCAGLGHLTFMNTLLNLKGINASAISNSAVSDFNDYKAIVCILLAGGNDSFNMLAPYDPVSYCEYVNARNGNCASSGSIGSISNFGKAIPRTELTATKLNYSKQVGGITREWAVHPSMTGVRDLFNNDKLAFISNIGTLVRPTTKANYHTEGFELPISLFSHSDQIQQWQTGIPNERGAKGWAGKIADMIGDCNPNESVSMNISLSGSNIFQTGDVSVEYAIDANNGAIGIDSYDPTSGNTLTKARTAALDSMMGSHYNNIFEKSYINTISKAKDAYVDFNEKLAQSKDFGTLFPSSYFASSLEMIAKTIDVRNELGFKRQIFFVTVGGWDHHDDLLDQQESMLGMVSDALAAFQTSLGSGSNGINAESDVLTMFISEFGRTLASNSDGSDHAWGGNVMTMGGPVNGGVVYGDYPSLALGGPLEVDNRGRFVPTTSTDQYFRDAATWFGVPSTDIPLLFPNVGNFSSSPIGYI